MPGCASRWDSRRANVWRRIIQPTRLSTATKRSSNVLPGRRVLPMPSTIEWILNRPRVLFRAGRVLGLWTMLKLVRVRLTGTALRRYVLRIPGYAHPVFIRGGRSSDAIALYEVLVTQE